MTTGRKPIPTHLKVLTGNPGKRPLNPDEPMPEGDLIEPPAWLTESQKSGWRVAIEDAPRGMLKRIDRSVLTVWVVAEDLHRTASEAVVKFGLVTKTTRTQEPIQNPYLPIVNRQAQIMLKAAAELGFTPSSRTRVASGGAGTTGGQRRGNKFDGVGQRRA